MFSFIDLIYAGVILLFAIIGLVNGFIGEVFKKLTVAFSVIAGFLFSAKLSPYFQKIVNNSLVDTILAFVAIFIVCFILLKIVQMIMEKIFSGKILSSLNKTLGFAFGAVEGIFIICIVLILAKSQIWFNLNILTENSFFANILLPLLSVPIEKLHSLFV